MAVRASIAIPGKPPVSIVTSPAARTPTLGPPPVVERDHALDALRAAMMLLGIVLHAGLSYTHLPTRPLWPFKDRHTSMLCDAVMMASGLFRMPVFFLIAGYFAAMICRKRGIVGLVRNRARRILVPFIAAWIATFPLVRAGYLYAEALDRGETASMATLIGAFKGSELYAAPYPIHLWFLEYLLIYYAVAVLFVLWPGGTWQAARTWFPSDSRPLRPACVTAIPLLAAPMGVIPTPLSFIPEPVSLLAHGTFFATGWALFAHREGLPSLARAAIGRIILGLVLLIASAMILKFRALVMPPGWFGPIFPGARATLTAGAPAGLGLPGWMGFALGLISQAALALVGSQALWSLVLGITGLFLRTFDRPVGWVRYLADASYWLYLAHFPLMIWVPILLAPLEAPALVKLAVVLVLTMGVMLAAYEAMVRARATSFARHLWER
jgi:glucan biosynthesis protein C